MRGWSTNEGGRSPSISRSEDCRENLFAAPLQSLQVLASFEVAKEENTVYSGHPFTGGRLVQLVRTLP
jgi:hypothetical protein